MYRLNPTNCHTCICFPIHRIVLSNDGNDTILFYADFIPKPVKKRITPNPSEECERCKRCIVCIKCIRKPHDKILETIEEIKEITVIPPTTHFEVLLIPLDTDMAFDFIIEKPDGLAAVQSMPKNTSLSLDFFEHD
jgi:hypothetical protein